MENIEINEYVRTKDGVIAQFTHIETYYKDKIYWFDNTIYQDYEENISYLRDNNLEKYIKKHSFNIIDLIEVGDLVQIHDRGNRIYQVDRDYQGKLAIIDVDWNEYEELYNEDIKSIVTREMMESVEYRIE